MSDAAIVPPAAPLPLRIRLLLQYALDLHEDGKDAREHTIAKRWRKWARETQAALADATNAAAVAPLDDPRLQELFSAAILGALNFGAQGANPPPKGHWLTQFWNLAREQTKLQEDQPFGGTHETWRHRKSGRVYVRLAHALRESDSVPLVVYQATDSAARVWVRPATEFYNGFERLPGSAAPDALPTPAAVDQWQVVPKEPTDAMLDAAEEVVGLGVIDTCHVDDRVVVDGAWHTADLDHLPEGATHSVQGRRSGPARIYRAMLAAVAAPAETSAEASDAVR